MATLISHTKNYMTLEMPKTKAGLLAIPIGRCLFSLIFILSSFQHFSGDMIAYAEGHGVPLAALLVPVSGIISLLGGLSVLFGWHARFGAFLLIIFLVPVTIAMHNFWAIEDQQEAQSQMIHFMKNLSMLGAAIFFACLGAGPFSVDNRKK